MDPSRDDRTRPRVSRATSLRLERQKNSGPVSSNQDNPIPLGGSSVAAPQTRDPSPTKLPVGSFRRAASVRQPSGASAPPEAASHRRHGSTSSIRLRQNDVSGSRPAQGPVLRPVKESAFSKDENSKPSVATTGKVKPTTRQVSAQSRTASRESVNLRGAGKGKQEVPVTDSKALSNYTENSSARHRDSALGSTQAQSKELTSTAASTSGVQRRDAAQSQSLVDSSLELLQLHAIHSRAGKTQREWIESARKSYESQFMEIVAFREAVQAREKDLLMQRNASAVIEWGSRAGGDTLARRVQVLSSTLDEAWHLSSPTGRYSSIVQAFEHWYENATKLTVDSSTRSKGFQARSIVTEGLGDGWKAEVAALQDSLLQGANDILSLGDVEGESDIVRAITLALELIKNMLEELELMESVEQNIVQQQRGRVKASLNDLTREVSKQ